MSNSASGLPAFTAGVLMVFVTLALAAVTAAADDSSTTRFTLHVDDQTLYSRAGYFDYRYLYRGGVPSIAQQTESYQCTQFCTTTSCALPGNGNVTGSYCILWTVEERGSDQTSYGKCKCTQRGGAYCAAYTCDQSVTAYSTVCDDDCFVSSTTFGKVKTCTCADVPNSNATAHPYCRTYSCFGYGDGDVKTATWGCYVPASRVGGGFAYEKDFCWQFGSDQSSKSVAEVKDCQCTQASDDAAFCATWFCYDRTAKKWIWWSSILASPLAALLHLWVPFAAAYCDELGASVCLWFWALLTYLLVVLLGGVPSLIANTTALVLATVFVHRNKIREAFRRRKSSQSSDMQMHRPTVVDGISLCPACSGPWDGRMAEGRVTHV